MRGYCSAGAQAWQEGARNPCIDPPVRPYRIRLLSFLLPLHLRAAVGAAATGLLLTALF